MGTNSPNCVPETNSKANCGCGEYKVIDLLTVATKAGKQMRLPRYNGNERNASNYKTSADKRQCHAKAWKSANYASTRVRIGGAGGQHGSNYDAAHDRPKRVGA